SKPRRRNRILDRAPGLRRLSPGHPDPRTQPRLRQPNRRGRQRYSMVFRALLGKIKQGLAKTRGVFSGVAQLFRLHGRVDRNFLGELEKRLYLADVGTTATSQIVDRVRQAFLDKEITGDVEAFVKQELKAILAAGDSGLRYNLNGPTVIMIAGVNGSGKTTSI